MREQWACAFAHPTSRSSLRRLRRLLQQLVDVAGQDRLAVLAERAQLADEVAHRRRVRGSPADSRWRTRCARPGSRSARLHRRPWRRRSRRCRTPCCSADSNRNPFSASCRGGRCPACPRSPCPDTMRMRPSSAERPPPRCDMWIVRLGWRSNTPALISRIVAITRENSRPDRARGVVAVELLGLD